MKPREYHTAALQSDRLSGASRSHARDTRTFIFDDQVPPEIFVPLEQNARRDLTMVVRAADGSVGVAEAVREEIRRFDPMLPPVTVESMDDRISRGLSEQRLVTECGVSSTQTLPPSLRCSAAPTPTNRCQSTGLRLLTAITRPAR